MILPITSTAKLVIPTPSFKIRLTMILREKATIQITIYAEFLAHYQNSVFNPIKDDEDKKLKINLQVVLVRIESSAQLWLSH